MMKPYEIPIRSIPYPKEMECLGVRLSDLDLKFRKGFMEMSIDYEEVESLTGDDCDKFISALRNGPSELKNGMDTILEGRTWREYMDEKREDLYDNPESATKLQQEYMKLKKDIDGADIPDYTQEVTGNESIHNLKE